MQKNGEYVLKNINISINKGEIVGIIGTTGSGKSTLLDIINRSYLVQKGEVKLFGENIENYTKSCIKKEIKKISQRPSFISASIKENVEMGQQNINDQEVIIALEKAQAMEFVEKLNGKIGYELENNASNLSGGQKQRVSIARAFIGQEKILLLDDTTSALDLATEKKVLQAFYDKAKKDKTTILMSSQKISSVMGADNIIVLEAGKIIAKGRHEELLKKCDLYKQIWNLQMGGATK